MEIGKVLAAVVILFGLLVVAAVVTGVEVPEEEEIEFTIAIEDNEEEVAISMDDVGEYVMEKIEGEIGSIPQADHVEMFYSGAFRAALLGISEVWSGEVPSRDDIRIVSSLPEPGSALCFQYITGTGPSMEGLRTEEGEFKIVLVDGTEVEDLSIGNLHELSKDMDAGDWVFEISSISTGEAFEVVVKEDVFPEDFFELRKEVVFDQTASEKEEDEFTWRWTEIKDGFQGGEDYEFFEGLEEPSPSLSVVIILIAIIVAIGVLAVKI